MKRQINTKKVKILINTKSAMETKNSSAVMRMINLNCPKGFLHSKSGMNNSGSEEQNWIFKSAIMLQRMVHGEITVLTWSERGLPNENN